MKTIISATILGLLVGTYFMCHSAPGTPPLTFLLGGAFMGFMIGTVTAVTIARNSPKTDVIMENGELISAIPGKNDFGDYVISIVWKDQHGVIKTELISPDKKIVKVAGRTPHVLAWGAAITAGQPMIKKLKSVLQKNTGWAADVDEECRFEISMPETSLKKGYVFPLSA